MARLNALLSSSRSRIGRRLAQFVAIAAESLPAAGAYLCIPSAADYLSRLSRGNAQALDVLNVPGEQAASLFDILCAQCPENKAMVLIGPRLPARAMRHGEHQAGIRTLQSVEA